MLTTQHNVSFIHRAIIFLSSTAPLGLLAILLLLSYDAFALTDRYRAVWRDDPATTMVIGWNQRYSNVARLYYDVVDHGRQYESYRFRRMPDAYNTNKEMRSCFARLKNLQPNTVYYFVLVDDDGVSRRMSFKTAPADPSQKISLIAGGDSRNHRDARRDANKLVRKLRPTAVMFGGDMTADDTSIQWWDWLDDWQLTIGSDGRLFPIIVARGNHEADNQVLVDLFDIPHPFAYYGLTLGGNLLRIYTLNTLIAVGGNQRDWLEQDMAANQDVIWKIAQYHHPMLPHTTNKHDRRELVKYWATLFEAYNMDMAVECDAHVVKSTWPIRPARGLSAEDGFVRDDYRGTVYIGEGCWGAPLREADDNRSWTRNSGSFNQFAWIILDQFDVSVRIVKTDAADRVSEIDPYRPFTPPSGLVVWSPSNGDVIRLSRRNAGAIVAGNAGPPSLNPAQPPPSRTIIGRAGTSYNSPPPPPPPAVPMRQPLLKPDANGQVDIFYQLNRSGKVDIILIDGKMQEVMRKQLRSVPPGPGQTRFDCKQIDPGTYQLIVKCEGKVIARYKLAR